MVGRPKTRIWLCGGAKDISRGVCAFFFLFGVFVFVCFFLWGCVGASIIFRVCVCLGEPHIRRFFFSKQQQNIF